jgi:phosphatidylglycerol---prolipoprotein diacylglyceryl transferase
LKLLPRPLPSRRSPAPTMLPVLIEIGGFRVTTFGVSIALAFVLAAWVMAGALRRRGEDPDVAWDLAGWAAACGILGAKTYYLLLHLPQTLDHPWAAITSRSGLVWYGGFIGGTLGALLRLRRLGVPVRPAADAAAPALALGYAVGRIGCFLVGDDWGRPSSLPWAVAFPRGAPPSTAGNLRAFGVEIPAAVPDAEVLTVHPTQLYEAALSLLVLGMLVRLRPGVAPRPGTLGFAWLALAGLSRFAVEFLRAKDDRVLGPFSVAQAISLGLVAAGIAGVYALRARGGGAPPTPAPPPPRRRAVAAR